jgi:hypothetical protein
MSRTCVIDVWKLLIWEADKTTLNEAFNIACQNNMADKVEICLQNPALFRGEKVSEALISAVELAAQTNLERQHLMLIDVLLKNGNGDVNFENAKSMKTASEAGHTQILELILEHSPSIQSLNDTLILARNSSTTSRDPVIRLLLNAKHRILGGEGGSQHFQPFTQSQISQTSSGLPQELDDGVILEAASKGVPQDCEELLELLTHLKPRITKSSFGAVLGELLQLSSKNAEGLTPKTLEVVGYLLSNSTYRPEVDAAFCRTLSCGNLTGFDGFGDAAELLAHSTLKTTFDIALNTVTLKSKFSDDDLWRIHSLIEWGATGESVHLALCLTLYARMYAKVPMSDDFIRTLVNAEHDVNHEDGEVLRVAADCGNTEILGKLLTSTASRRTKSFAFAVAVLAKHEERVLLALIDVFMTNESGPPVVQEVPERYFPNLFVCLQLYPRSRKLAECLIQAGCSVDSQTKYPCEGHSLEEKVTTLIWALCQVEADIQISSDVIDILIENGKCPRMRNSSMPCESLIRHSN